MDSKKKYTESIGRRKTSIARVRIVPAAKTSYTVNDKKFEDYFVTARERAVVASALKDLEIGENFLISVVVRGGGIHSQAEAVKLGIARAVVKFNADYRKQVKDKGLLTRDSRIKERRKFGLKKARKAPQWSKR